MKKGKLHIVTGCMFSKKSLELLTLIDDLKEQEKEYICFSPIKDYIFSRASQVKEKAIHVDKDQPMNILFEVGLDCTDSNSKKVIIIDEIQFFNDTILEVVQVLLDKGFNIYSSGLDKNFKNEVFGVMGQLLGIAYSVVKKHTTCSKCGNEEADCSQRMFEGKPADVDSPILVLDKSANSEQKEYYYEARCLSCYNS